MIVKVLGKDAIVSVASLYVPQCGLDKGDIREKRNCCRCLNERVGGIAEDYGEHQGYGFGVRNKESKIIIMVWEIRYVRNGKIT